MAHRGIVLKERQGAHKPKAAYKRIFLKLSGEAFLGGQKFGIDHKACLQIAKSICEIAATGVQIGIVVGGGNIFLVLNLKNSI